VLLLLHPIAINDTHTPLCRIPLDKWSACRKVLTWQHTPFAGDIHTPAGIWTRSPCQQAAADPRFRLRGHRDRPFLTYHHCLMFHWMLIIDNCFWNYILCVNQRCAISYRVRAWTLRAGYNIQIMRLGWVSDKLMCVTPDGSSCYEQPRGKKIPPF